MTNYAHLSHNHCWKQVAEYGSSACGIPLKDHKQCCLCDLTPPQSQQEGWAHRIMNADTEYDAEMMLETAITSATREARREELDGLEKVVMHEITTTENEPKENGVTHDFLSGMRTVLGMIRASRASLSK